MNNINNNLIKEAQHIVDCATMNHVFSLMKKTGDYRENMINEMFNKYFAYYIVEINRVIKNKEEILIFKLNDKMKILFNSKTKEIETINFTLNEEIAIQELFHNQIFLLNI